MEIYAELRNDLYVLLQLVSEETDKPTQAKEDGVEVKTGKLLVNIWQEDFDQNFEYFHIQLDANHLSEVV